MAFEVRKVAPLTPADHAARVYAEAYDRLATEAQLRMGEGRPIAAAVIRHRAKIALRAWEAELRR